MLIRAPCVVSLVWRLEDTQGILIDELHRRQLRYGLATLCVGGGMGIATIVERVCPGRQHHDFENTAL